MAKEYLKECFICETNRFDALDEGVWNNLVVSKEVYFNDIKDDRVLVKVEIDTMQYIIGVLSKEDSESIIKFIKQGWHEIFHAEICRVDKNADENKRFSIAISVKENEKKKIEKNAKTDALEVRLGAIESRLDSMEPKK